MPKDINRPSTSTGGETPYPSNFRPSRNKRSQQLYKIREYYKNKHDREFKEYLQQKEPNADLRRQLESYFTDDDLQGLINRLIESPTTLEDKQHNLDISNAISARLTELSATTEPRSLTETIAQGVQDTINSGNFFILF